MHLPDALVTPAVSIPMLAAMGGAAVYSARRLAKPVRTVTAADLLDNASTDEAPRKFGPALLIKTGVFAALVFAAQMLNIPIPGTGISWHLTCGVLVAAALGAEAGFLAVVIVLAAQALFLADGGLLAMGWNIFNLAFLPCFVAWPLCRRLLRRPRAAAALAAPFSVILGVFGLGVPLWLSGSAPFFAFILLTLPLYIVAGLIEGGVTALALGYIGRDNQSASSEKKDRRILIYIAIAAALLALIALAFSSQLPDGLEHFFKG